MSTTEQPTLFETALRGDGTGRTYGDEPPKARASDPPESHEAAAGKADEIAGEQVASVLRDGKPRTDEQIYAELKQRGYDLSDSRARHGRLHLQRGDKVKKAGRVPRDPETGRGPFALFQWVHHDGGRRIECGYKHAAWLCTRGQTVEL